MPPSEIKKDAKVALKGKWGKGICILLAYMLFTFALGFVEGIFENNDILFVLIEIAVLLISVPLSFGLTISFIKLKRGEDIKAFGFIKDGFSRFSKSWGISLRTLLKLLLPIVCIILAVLLILGLTIFNAISDASNSFLNIISVIVYISSIVYVVSRALLYTISYYISYDNPELSSKECVLKSEELMKGNRGNYFLLELSFIGWAILTCFTFGIGLLWLVPYLQVAVVCFYERVAKIEAKTTKEVVEEEKIEE